MEEMEVDRRRRNKTTIIMSDEEKQALEAYVERERNRTGYQVSNNGVLMRGLRKLIELESAANRMVR